MPIFRVEVQGSSDGKSFETLGTTKGRGNSTTSHAYAFVDGKPLAGLAYYRLRQVDLDGIAAFSPLATVEAVRELAVAYPNPSTGSIMLPAGLGAVQYRLYNAMGHTLLRGQGTGNDRLDIGALPKGPFFLELTSPTGRTTQHLLHE